MKKNSSDQNLEYWNTAGSQKTFNNPNLVLTKLDYLAKESAILDIGCGYGRTLSELALNGYSNLHGIDYSNVMISRAKEILPGNVNLKQSKATSLPFNDKTFDIVLLYAVLNCIPSPKEEAKIIQEALRILKTGGYLLINDFVMTKPLDKYKISSDIYGKFGYFKVEEQCSMRHTTPERIINMLGDNKLIFQSIGKETSMNGNSVEILSCIFKVIYLND